MAGLSEIIRELDGLISAVLGDAATTNAAERRIGIIGLEISINTRPLAIPERQQQGSLVWPRHDGTEPLIDAIEDDDSIRVIALFPGIRKEDIHYTVSENSLEIVIFGKRVYRKTICCTLRPEEVSVRSSTLNNSVLEIVFSKGTPEKPGL